MRSRSDPTTPVRSIIALLDLALSTRSSYSVDEAPLTEDQRQLAAKWMPLLYKIVHESAQNQTERDDLISRLQAALLRAARKFDPAKGYTFQAYATRILKNAVIDEHRYKLRSRIQVGFDAEHLEAMANDDRQPVPCKLADQQQGPAPEQQTQHADCPQRPEERALEMLRDGYTNRQIMAETSLKEHQITRLVKQRKIERQKGFRSRLTPQLARSFATVKDLQRDTGLHESTIRYRLRYEKKARNQRGTSCKNRQRRKYRPKAYILEIMKNDQKGPRKGRPLAIPDHLLPEMSRRQREGATIVELRRWLETQKVFVGIATISRTFERIGAVRRAMPKLEIIEQIPEPPDETPEETERKLRRKLRDEAFDADDWKQRHSAVKLLRILSQPRKAEASDAKPTPAPVTIQEDEEAAVAAYLGKRN